MNWAETKKNIAANFCRTVLVLDDEILVHANGAPESLDHGEQFLKAKAKFAENGILCDLRNVEDTVAADSEAMRACLRHADVVVVDWYLGAKADKSKDPRESIAVLDALLKIGGERFVAIHSKEVDKTIRENLRSRFELTTVVDEFEGETEEEDVTPLIEGQVSALAQPSQPGLYTLSLKKPDDEISGYRPNSRIHLCILHKSNPSQTAEALPSAIIAALERAFPDHLHWIGLDFASRVKDMLPGLVRSLPSDMDVALVFQALVMSPNELATDIAECLCLELQELLRIAPLDSARDSVVLSRFVGGLEPLKDSKVACVPPAWVPQLLSTDLPVCPKEWAKSTGILGKQNLQAIGTLIENALKQKGGISVKSHARYAALREHLHSLRAGGIPLYPGVVLRKSISESDAAISGPQWMLCLTPACDCSLSSVHEHLFVFGYDVADTANTTGRGVRTSIHIGAHEVELKWMVASFHTHPCTISGRDGWTPITRLRDPIVQKIVQSLWGQQSRVGINTSEYQRVIRKGKEDQ